MDNELSVQYTIDPLHKSEIDEGRSIRRVTVTTHMLADEPFRVEYLHLPEKEALLLCGLMKDNATPPSVNQNGWHNKKSFLIELAKRIRSPTFWLEHGGKYLNIRFDSRTGHANIVNAEPGEEKWANDSAQNTNTDNVAIVDSIRRAVKDYYFALDSRAHGSLAANRCLNRIESTLGMHWVQGEVKAERES